MKSFKKKYPKTAKALRVAGGVASTAYTAYKLASSVAQLVNAESKYNDYIGPTTITSTTPTVAQLDDIAQGSGDQQRNGNSILPKYLYVKGIVSCNTANTNNTQGVRIMIVKDKNDNNGTAPSISGATGVLTAITSLTTFLNKDNSERFRVLFDKTFIINPQNPVMKFKFYKQFRTYTQGGKPKAMHITYAGANGTDTSKDHLYLMAYSLYTAAQNPPVLDLHSRLGFNDN